MFRAVLTLLVGLMLSVSGSAFALSLNCERTTNSHAAFSTQQAFESWFPRYVRPTAEDQVPASKDTQVRFQINGVIYDLTPSKWMAGKLPEKAGYKSVTGVRYKCNASAARIKSAFRRQIASNNSSNKASTASLSAGRSSNSSEIASMSWNDKKLCQKATKVIENNGVREKVWDRRERYSEDVKLAKSRGLTCGVSESVSTKAASINSSNLPACPSDRGYWHNCFGTFTNANGDSYTGDYKYDQPNGKGTYLFANGDKYVGDFKDNKYHGHGTYTGVDGTKYIGEYRDNDFNGKGEYFFANGDKYVGEFKDRNFNGQGTFTFFNGDEYQGEYENGLRHGHGRLTSADGSWLEGTFKDGQPHGAIRGYEFSTDRHWNEDFLDGEITREVDPKAVEWASLNPWFKNDIPMTRRAVEIHTMLVNAGWDPQSDDYYLEVDRLMRESFPAYFSNPTPNSQNSASSAANPSNSAELASEREKRIQLEQELAALKAQQEEQQQTITNDNQIPLIEITSVSTVGKQGVIQGYASDNTGVAEVVVDGFAVPLTSTGSFEYRTFVPANGISVQVQATDLAGLTSVMSVSLERSASTATASITFDRLNPLGKHVKENRDALALIVGVADYENTPAKAIFADSDALMFRDYASEKLGIPENRIKTLVDDGADIREVLLGVKRWLARAVKQDQSDVYVFFAGHGLASDDGEKMYLLPYDGAPELLDKTAILRDELFTDIAAANPRSVTVFLDTCYSGTTRGPDMLIASRPIAIRAKEQAVPEGFTVMTAAAGDQTAKPLEEAKHGMFSYFLMKGMEGDADANQDNQITAGELQEYVYQNVVQQSSGSQTPELQGDADRVLVRFQ